MGEMFAISILIPMCVQTCFPLGILMRIGGGGGGDGWWGWWMREGGT